MPDPFNHPIVKVVLLFLAFLGGTLLFTTLITYIINY